MLAKVGKVVNNSWVVPAHRNVRLAVPDIIPQKFTIQACNTEATIMVTAQEEEFTTEVMGATSSVAVEYKKLNNLVIGFKEGKLELQFFKDEVIIKKYMTNNSYQLATFPEQEFIDLCIPHVPNDERSIHIEDSAMFATELSRGAMFVGKSADYPALVHVLLSLKDCRLNMYGSDRQKTYGSYITVCNGNTWRYVISEKTVDSIVQLLKGEGEVVLATTSSLLQIGTEDNYLVSSVVALGYPEIERMLNIGSNVVFTVNKEQLQDCLGRLAIVTEHPFMLRVIVTKDCMKFFGGDGCNKGEEEIPVEGYSGMSIKLSVNGAHMSQGIVACDKEVHFGMTDDRKPIVIKSKTDSNDTCLIMPINNPNQ